MKFSLLFLTLFGSSIAFTQEVSINEIVQLEIQKVDVYDAERSTEKLYIEMKYGKSVILNPADAKKLIGQDILSIDMVGTDYPKKAISQTLTQKRLAALKKCCPTIFQNKTTVWQRIQQTNCSDLASAQKMFHGFAITYGVAKPKVISSEIRYLKEGLARLSRKPTEKTTETFSESRFTTQPKDSVVLKVFERQQNWTNQLIAADLTGSMSPYTLQLLTWLRLNTMDGKEKHFVFFNDGDETPDDLKVIGKTGGIYHTRTADFNKVDELAIETMAKGNGGDGPENNIEALLKAATLCPECTDLVLIADNAADIKDISLLSEVKKPVKVILCATSGAPINPQYLELARATGGSVHTITEDLLGLMKLNDGQTITIHEQMFRIEKGKFIRVTRM